MGDISNTVFKIFRASEWHSFKEAGHFLGSADDLRDGFIHLSQRKQVRRSVTKHFGAEADVVVAAFYSADLGDSLKWEAATNGALYPHLYSALEYEKVVSFVLWSNWVE